MASDDIAKALQTRVAMEMIQHLTPEEREALLSQAVLRAVGDKLHIDYEVQKLLSDEGKRFAAKYIKQPEIQEKLRTAAHEAVDSVIDGIVKIIGKGIEEDIKSKYQPIYDKR